MKRFLKDKLHICSKDHVMLVQGSHEVPHYKKILLVQTLMFPLENRVGLSFEWIE